ncbi:hypothetical protein D9Q98_004194 [Chlorella vulgaris]|uniref:Uncharacterized protein n=1 Tax=Chlorella vulgaris TaxID=3077 RepID=A0A9D4TRK9_CHLVU|nr:hypothetical protein D9Q98_004194 [Chlorella vulgaris]
MALRSVQLLRRIATALPAPAALQQPLWNQGFAAVATAVPAAASAAGPSPAWGGAGPPQAASAATRADTPTTSSADTSSAPSAAAISRDLTAASPAAAAAASPEVYVRLDERVGDVQYTVQPKRVFAVVEVGGTQYKVTPNDVIVVEKLADVDVQDKLQLRRVLMLGSQAETIIGRPYVPEAAVIAAVEEQFLDGKVLIFHKRRRKNSRRLRGHRQPLTTLRILDVDGIAEAANGDALAGVAGATLLLLNHFLANDAPSDAQGRAEALGIALAAVAFATPTIEQRLKELQPGRGRQAVAARVEGASSVFVLQPGAPDALQQELAWASYALLLNTNICGLAVFWRGQAVLARGLLGVPSMATPPAASAVVAASDVLAALSGTELARASSCWQQGVLFCPDRAAMGSSGAGNWACVPEGAQSLLVQPLQPFGQRTAGSTTDQASQGILLLLSERPRAMSAKERSWASAVAAKLHDSLAQVCE